MTALKITEDVSLCILVSGVQQHYSSPPLPPTPTMGCDLCCCGCLLCSLLARSFRPKSSPQLKWRHIASFHHSDGGAGVIGWQMPTFWIPYTKMTTKPKKQRQQRWIDRIIAVPTKQPYHFELETSRLPSGSSKATPSWPHYGAKCTALLLRS